MDVADVGGESPGGGLAGGDADVDGRKQHAGAVVAEAVPPHAVAGRQADRPGSFRFDQRDRGHRAVGERKHVGRFAEIEDQRRFEVVVDPVGDQFPGGAGEYDPRAVVGHDRHAEQSAGFGTGTGRPGDPRRRGVAIGQIQLEQFQTVERIVAEELGQRSASLVRHGRPVDRQLRSSGQGFLRDDDEAGRRRRCHHVRRDVDDLQVDPERRRNPRGEFDESDVVERHGRTVARDRRGDDGTVLGGDADVVPIGPAGIDLVDDRLGRCEEGAAEISQVERDDAAGVIDGVGVDGRIDDVQQRRPDRRSIDGFTRDVTVHMRGDVVHDDFVGRTESGIEAGFQKVVAGFVKHPPAVAADLNVEGSIGRRHVGAAGSTRDQRNAVGFIPQEQLGKLLIPGEGLVLDQPRRTGPEHDPRPVAADPEVVDCDVGHRAVEADVQDLKRVLDPVPTDHGPAKIAGERNVGDLGRRGRLENDVPAVGTDLLVEAAESLAVGAYGNAGPIAGLEIVQVQL